MSTKVIKLKLFPHDYQADAEDEAKKKSWREFHKMIRNLQYQVMQIKNAVSCEHTLYMMSTKMGEKPEVQPQENHIYQRVLRTFVENEHDYIVGSSIANTCARSVRPLFSKAHGQEFWNGDRLPPMFRRDTAIYLSYDKKSAGVGNSSGSIHILNNKTVRISLLSKHIGDWRYTGQTCFDFPIAQRNLDNSTRVILERILNGEYKPGVATLYRKRNDVFVNISYETPAKTVKRIVPGRCLGVNLGIRWVAACACSDNWRIKLLFDEQISRELQMYRNRNQARIAEVGRVSRKNNEKRSGHGRKNKLRLFEHLSGKRREYQKTLNHKISRAIVEFAKSVGAGVIVLEDLKGIYEKGKCPQKKLRNWSYFELQQFIAYKAAEWGIDVIYNNPAWITNTCPQCGCVYADRPFNRKKQFRCESCGRKEHRDINAAINNALCGAAGVDGILNLRDAKAS